MLQLPVPHAAQHLHHKSHQHDVALQDRESSAPAFQASHPPKLPAQLQLGSRGPPSEQGSNSSQAASRGVHDEAHPPRSPCVSVPRHRHQQGRQYEHNGPSLRQATLASAFAHQQASAPPNCECNDHKLPKKASVHRQSPAALHASCATWPQHARVASARRSGLTRHARLQELPVDAIPLQGSHDPVCRRPFSHPKTVQHKNIVSHGPSPSQQYAERHSPPRFVPGRSRTENPDDSVRKAQGVRSDAPSASDPGAAAVGRHPVPFVPA
eukprot:11228309-Lingulodinium_polyedra.AAC.1